MPIRLHDSLTRSLKELKPAQPDGVFRFYNCGPTVYAPAHIGNFRTFVVNDVIRRLLELEHPGKVKHVRNLTDVDDKTIKRARDEGRPLAEVTRQWTDKFHADCDALNCLRPHAEPTATGHIREQVDMIDVLMKKGNAYRAADGSVYFKVSSFADYGKLSRVKERELLVTDATADSDHKNSVSDFALWKAYKPEEDGDVKWPGPRGTSDGRPGWHIECSAMSKAILGDTIDLHSGGEDLEFPHHENEIAQSECCNGTTFSRHWYHSKHLLVNGTTMSKSRGNYYTLGDLVAKGYSPMAVRYALLMGHPRKQLNFTLDSLHAAESALNKLAQWTLHGALSTYSSSVSEREYLALRSAYSGWSHFGEVVAALHDDLNFPAALGHLFTTLEKINSRRLSIKERIEFERVTEVIFGAIPGVVEEPITTVPTAITALAEKRWAAKQSKDFAAADSLRQELAAAGWSMLDRKDGYSLEPLKKA